MREGHESVHASKRRAALIWPRRSVQLLMARRLPSSAGISTKRAETRPRIDRRNLTTSGVCKPNFIRSQASPPPTSTAGAAPGDAPCPALNRRTESKSLLLLEMEPGEPTQSETALVRWQAVLVSLSSKSFTGRRAYLDEKKRLMASWRLLCTDERAKDRIVRASTATQCTRCDPGGVWRRAQPPHRGQAHVPSSQRDECRSPNDKMSMPDRV